MNETLNLTLLLRHFILEFLVVPDIDVPPNRLRHSFVSVEHGTKAVIMSPIPFSLLKCSLLSKTGRLKLKWAIVQVARALDNFLDAINCHF